MRNYTFLLHLKFLFLRKKNVKNKIQQSARKQYNVINIVDKLFGIVLQNIVCHL
jgi:hypothetical protein